MQARDEMNGAGQSPLLSGFLCKTQLEPKPQAFEPVVENAVRVEIDLPPSGISL
jgi:hypothetical protein